MGGLNFTSPTFISSQLPNRLLPFFFLLEISYLQSPNFFNPSIPAPKYLAGGLIKETYTDFEKKYLMFFSENTFFSNNCI